MGQIKNKHRLSDGFILILCARACAESVRFVTNQSAASEDVFSRPTASLLTNSTGLAKKRGTLHLSISSPIIDEFSKFIHWHALRTMCNNVIRPIIYPTTP